MSFTYPMGLLGLIGIPILIILYIIKSHYVEQTVASVYLWELSEKFLKRRKKLRFGGLLSLLLEILAVAAISLTIARPNFILKDAANDYCFVLDISGSMTASVTADDNGKTRFEVGKERIRELIEDSKDGSTYSLIVAGSTTYEVYRQIEDKESALSFLDSVDCSQSAAGCSDALSVAQNYYSEDHSPLTYLVTDKAYETQNITLINVAESEENYAFVSYTHKKNISETVVSGQVISYDRDAELHIDLYVDGEKASDVSVQVSKLTPTEFSMTVLTDSFQSLRLQITNEDRLPTDNEGILYSSGEVENNKTLLVSDAPAYLEYVLKASGKTSVDTVSTGRYSQNKDGYTGYGLYIFDSFTDSDKLPNELPKNATIWFFNLQKSIPKTGFSFREVVEAEGTIGGGTSADGTTGAEKENRFEPTYTTSTASFAKMLTKGILGQTIAVKKYSRYVPGRNFTSLLNQDNDSLIFVGNNENGDRQVVFSFDLHDSDYALKADFLILMKNLLDYSFPAVVEQTLYTVGDDALINVPSGCTDLLLEAPSGKITYPDFSSSYSYCHLDQVGTYRLIANVNGVEQEYSLFAQMPKEESYEISAGTLSLEKQSDSTSSDGYYDRLVIYFLILAIAFVMDWGVYCYEQYQLR